MAVDLYARACILAGVVADFCGDSAARTSSAWPFH